MPGERISESGKLRISVVLSTYNRADTLPKTLEHLARQELDPKDYEIIVVDDGSPDNTRQVVEEIKPSIPCQVDYLHHSNKGPGYTHNRGIRRARAPIVLLMADDIFFTPSALREHLDFHRRHPEQDAAVLGRVLQSPELNQSVFLRTWDPFRFFEHEHLKELAPYRFGACNVSFKREFMLQYGMFRDERGRAGAAALEDLEVGYRLAKHGMRLYYEPRALGYHYHVVTLDQAIERRYSSGLNYGEFRRFATEPELTVYFHVLNSRTLREYIQVLRGPNSFEGKEKSIAWHMFRECLRKFILNRFTARWFWRPMLNRAEVNPWLASLMNRQIYRAFLYFHFLRGVHDAYELYGDERAQ
jgi:glycosyltransferase involved in cell wall biosynthesis